MRIGLIAHHSAPVAAPFSGGLEAMTWYFARWLARRGHDVTLFGPPGTAVPGVTTIALDLHPTVSDLARADVSMPPDRFLDAHYAYQRLMTDLASGRHRFDVIHLHALHYLPVALNELLDTPVAMTLHSPPTPWLEAALRASRRPPRLIAVSRATAEMWRGCAPVDTVIPNGIDLDMWPAGPGGDDLAWCGRIVPEKAPHLALDAARRAGRMLRIAGPVIDRGYFEKNIAPRLEPRDGQAVYAGHLGHAALSGMLATSAALLQTPMWDEPFGLTAPEAMATGTPVVSFARGGVPEVIGRRGGLLVEPGDVGGLAAAARTAAGMCRAGVRDHARATFGMDRTGLAYEAVYERMQVTSARPRHAIDRGPVAGRRVPARR